MIETNCEKSPSLEDRQNDFNNAVAHVYNIFPREDVAKGQLYDTWETCNKYLPQVLILKDRFIQERALSPLFRATGEFCELLIQCQRYLYETNALQDLSVYCDVSLYAVNSLEDSPQKHDLRATVLSHQANLAESLGRASEAIELNKQAYEIRLQELPMKQQLLCYISNNIGYCHNTANDHKQALQWFQKSQDWWAAAVSEGRETRECPAFIVKNTARCMVYLDDFDDAANLLDVAISRLEREEPSNWAMRAYAYFVKATILRRQENWEAAEAFYIKAQNTWLEGDQARLHPFNGGCLYRMGTCCIAQGKYEAAIKHIREALEVTGLNRTSMPVEHARNLLKLVEVVGKTGCLERMDEMDKMREEAKVCLMERHGSSASLEVDKDLDSLIPIFWR